MKNVEADWIEDASLWLDHVGIAVRSIDTARKIYAAMGMRVGDVATIEQEQVKAAMVLFGESRIELIEPMVSDSHVGKFLRKRGEGLHHIAFRADAVDVKFRQLEEQGVRLTSDSVRVGAGGHRYFFVHPASAGGVLIEFVGNTVHIEIDDETNRERRVETARTGTDG